MRIMLLLAVVGLMAACAPDLDSGQVTRVIIRSGSAVDTVYEMGANGKAASSQSQTGYAGEVRRTYSYDAEGRLSSVYREDAAGRGSTVVVNPAAASKSVRAGGDEMGLSTKYFYAAGGGLDGLIQTDALGNVMSKSVSD